MDILITSEAKKKLDELLATSDKKCIRILTRNITMTEPARVDFELDEMKPGDRVYELDGYKIVINQQLDSQMNGLTISYGGLLSRNAFSIDADFCFYY